MTTYKVTYFDIKGAGEVLRLALVASGQQFEDERLDRETWLTRKPNAPAKQLPLLTVTENGKETVYCQSTACAKYIARKFGLFGSSPEEQLLVDEAFECMMDVMKEMSKIRMEPDENRKAELQKKLCDEVLPRFNDYLKLRTSQYGQNGYIIGSKMTLADLQLYNLVDQSSERIEGLWKGYEDILRHSELVKSDQKVAAWRQSIPK